MLRKWKYVYLGWAILCVLSGYSTLAPERTARCHMPWPVIVGAFFFFCVGPLMVTGLNHLFGREVIFRRPSLDRTPFSKGDLLQAFRLFSVSSALMAVGASFALPHADHNGVMMFWSGVAMAAGLLVGEQIVYLVYAKKIA